jgi:hypothetical protein
VACPHYHLGLTDRVSRPLGLLSRIHIFRHGLLTGRVLNNLTEFRGHETELRAAIAARPVDSAVVPRDGISMPPPPVLLGRDTRVSPVTIPLCFLSNHRVVGFLIAVCRGVIYRCREISDRTVVTRHTSFLKSPCVF